ncbi:MAG: glycosyltransferase family 4 protein [Verrucomicrobia bacterium]|nr:glycosyltransferase family 4 protein [Verrucomicrobiota bacterium]
MLTIHSADLYGAGRSLLDHALALRGGALNFTALLPEHGPLEEALKAHGIPVWVGPSRKPAAFYRFALGTLQREGRPLCHVHSTFPLAAALAARRAGCPILWHVREERQRSVERRRPGLRRWGSRALSEIRRLAIGLLANRIIYVSEAVRRQFAFPGKPSDVLFNFLPDLPPPVRARAPGTPLTLLYVGRVCLEKGAEEFAGICRGLLDRGVSFRAVMAGSTYADSADFPARLAAMGLGERVRMTGYQPDLESIYEDVDVLLFPSHTEGFGRPVMEAMARGIVVVASRVGGIPEMIDHGRTGFLFDLARPGEAVEILARLERDAALARAVGARARESTTRLFSREAYVEKMSRIYREMDRTRHAL